jgi:hypothetical protein
MNVALLHLLPESEEAFQNLLNNNFKHFPINFFLAFLGYTIILMIEKILFESHSHHSEDEDMHLPPQDNINTVNNLI